LSKQRTALILKKLITGQMLSYGALESLAFDFRELAYIVMQVGTDPAAREGRLRAELLARNQGELWEAVQRVDSATDLQTVGESWEFQTLADACKSLPPLLWAVRGIISRPSISIFFGGPKNLKSLLLLDLAVCVAAGKRWLANEKGEGGIETLASPVIWLDLENGARRMCERISAFGRGRQLPESVPLPGRVCRLHGLIFPERRWLVA
jgi:RecA-family ATPase